MNVGHLDKLRVKKLKKFAAIFQDVKLHWTSFNPSATRSDQWVISPHNVNIFSRRDVMRTKISISQRISFDGTLNSQREDYDKCMSYREEKWQLNLGVREFVKNNGLSVTDASKSFWNQIMSTNRKSKLKTPKLLTLIFKTGLVWSVWQGVTQICQY